MNMVEVVNQSTHATDTNVMLMRSVIQMVIVTVANAWTVIKEMDMVANRFSHVIAIRATNMLLVKITDNNSSAHA